MSGGIFLKAFIDNEKEITSPFAYAEKQRIIK